MDADTDDPEPRCSMEWKSTRRERPDGFPCRLQRKRSLSVDHDSNMYTRWGRFTGAGM